MAQTPSDRVTRRYRDAYLVANSIVGFGTGVKAIGVVLAFLIGIAGFAAAKALGVSVGVVCGLLGVAIGAVIFMLGVLISAQGQMHYAILDVAVNTSPVLPEATKGDFVADLAPKVAEGVGEERNHEPDEAPGGKVKCWKCGKTNSRGQDKCWDCYTPLFVKP